MTDILGKLDKMFNTAGENYDQKQTMIDPEKLIAASDRIRQMLQEEEKERQKRLAKLEEAAEKLRREIDQVFNKLMVQDDPVREIAVQINEDIERVAGVQQAMASGTTQQLSVPRTARFRLTR